MTLLSGFVCHLSGSINGLWGLSLRSRLNLSLWSLSLRSFLNLSLWSFGLRSFLNLNLWSFGLRSFLNLNLWSLSLRSFLNLNLWGLSLRGFLNLNLWSLGLRSCYSWSLNRGYNFSFFFTLGVNNSNLLTENRNLLGSNLRKTAITAFDFAFLNLAVFTNVDFNYLALNILGCSFRSNPERIGWRLHYGKLTLVGLNNSGNSAGKQGFPESLEYP